MGALAAAFDAALLAGLDADRAGPGQLVQGQRQVQAVAARLVAAQVDVGGGGQHWLALHHMVAQKELAGIQVQLGAGVGRGRRPRGTQ
ncbi:hypothetical protein NWF32_16990 [Pseudomonas qingdaonensis]|nr:hypothetical protein [Pseudomonas qingdaonensis]